MSRGNDDLRDQVLEAKRRLPLPQLFERLGIETKGNGQVRKNPLREDDGNLSFSTFEREGGWGWKDHATEQGGDEINFLEAHKGLTRAEAVREYLALAGVENAPQRHGKAAASRPSATAPARPARAAKATSHPPIDWQKCVEAIGDDDLDKLAAWRGYSRDFCAWLRDRGLVGLAEGCFALPVHDDQRRVIAAHLRLGTSGRWKYAPQGVGVHPLVIGPHDAENLLCFESQWDAFAFMERGGWHREEPEGWAVVATRGKSNGGLVAAPGVPRTKGCIAIVQNDTAGEAWLAKLEETFAGERVFAIRPPAGVKDFNDWTRAEAVDVWQLIADAKAIDRSAKTAAPAAPNLKPPAPSGNDLEGLADGFGLYWLDGSEKFFRRSADGLRFFEVGIADIRRKLKVLGMASKPAEGETCSVIDRLLVHVQDHRAVDWAGGVAGFRAGVYPMQGKRVLVKDSPEIPSPAAGEWPIIRALIEGRLDVPDFGARQLATFYGWCKCGYESLLSGEHRPGQALVLCGPSDCGKSRIQNQLITPLLGGRQSDPAPFLIGRTDFNSELISAEHHQIEDMPSAIDMRSREFFGEMIKASVIGDIQRSHKKGRDAITLSPFRRLSMSMNDNPERMKVLPPISSDLRDKIVLLKAQSSPLPMPLETGEDWRHFREAIKRELPAFCHFLTQYQVPEDLRSRRFEVRYFHHPEILSALMENEPDQMLALLIDQRLFEADERSGWRGTALELQQLLTDDESKCAAEARKLFSYSTACGVYLARLADKHPERYINDRSAKKREWIIRAPGVSV